MLYFCVHYVYVLHHIGVKVLGRSRGHASVKLNDLCDDLMLQIPVSETFAPTGWVVKNDKAKTTMGFFWRSLDKWGKYTGWILLIIPCTFRKKGLGSLFQNYKLLHWSLFRASCHSYRTAIDAVYHKHLPSKQSKTPKQATKSGKFKISITSSHSLWEMSWCLFEYGGL